MGYSAGNEGLTVRFHAGRRGARRCSHGPVSATRRALPPVTCAALALDFAEMSTPDDTAGWAAELPMPFEVLAPRVQTLPLVVASPHSGSIYPADFLASSRLDAMALRRSEDCFVDEIYARVPDLGAPLIRALFPRAFLDVNREPFELDPRMFEDALPGWVVSRSPRITAGLGTIARVVATGCEIYRGKLRFEEALRRVGRLYRPYHEALADLVRQTRARFGYCILLDAHSMPSMVGRAGDDLGGSGVDFVIGDCHGASCAPELPDLVDEVLSGLGYGVVRNDPYPGGFTTRHYGRPATGVHAIQIEVNRALYMDEQTYARRPGFVRLAQDLTALVEAVGRRPPIRP